MRRGGHNVDTADLAIQFERVSRMYEARHEAKARDGAALGYAAKGECREIDPKPYIYMDFEPQQFGSDLSSLGRTARLLAQRAYLNRFGRFI